MLENILSGETVISASESLGKLVIQDGAIITAPENQRVILTVDGVQRDLDPGAYEGDVKLSVIDGVIVDYETHGSVDHYCMANAVSFENGKYAENQSVTAVWNADADVRDGYVKNLKVVSRGDNFGGIMVRDGEAVIEDVEMDLIGNGGCDFTGEGVGITAMGSAKVTVNRAKIHTVGSIRAAVVGREDAELVVNDSELFAADGDKPNNIHGMTKVPWMLGLTGRVRTTNLVDKAHVVYNRCHVKCENWGTFSTDGTQPGAHLEMRDCVIESEKCGYGAYSIGECLDEFSGCTMNMGNYPLIMCAEGSGLFTNACQVNSRKVGVMMHGGQGSGTLTINGKTVFNTARAVLQVKGQGAYIEVSDSALPAVKLISVKESLIVSHEQLSFQLFHGLKRNTYKDQDRRAAEPEVDAAQSAAEVSADYLDNRGEYCQHRKKDSAEPGKFRGGLFNEVRRGSTGSETGNEAAVLFKVIGDIVRVKVNDLVEERENYDQHCVHDNVSPGLTLGETVDHAGETCCRRGFANEGNDRSRELKHRHREDYRKHAGGVDLERNVSALSAVDLAADNSFSVLYRDPAFAAFHPDNGNDYCKEYHDQREHYRHVEYCAGGKLFGAASENIFPERHCGGRSVGYDTGEDQHGDTVADALFGDALTHPHKERGTCGTADGDR